MKTQALRQALDQSPLRRRVGRRAARRGKIARQGARVLVAQRAVTAGIRSGSGPSRGALQRAQAPGRKHPRVPAVELDRARRLALHPSERIPVVPLYFAAPRPVVERDGALIMVDDERLPLEPGERPQIRERAVSHARLLSADRRHREHGAHRPRNHPGDAGEPVFRTARPRHRPRRRDVDGAQKAGRIFLMNVHAQPAERHSPRRRCARQERKSLLRFIACGSVDHGKSTLIGRLLYESKQSVDDQLDALAGRIRASSARKATSSISRCCSTDWRPSASRRSRSTSPIASSRRRAASSSSSMRPGTRNIPPTWRPALRSPISRSILVAVEEGLTRQTKRHP